MSIGPADVPPDPDPVDPDGAPSGPGVGSDPDWSGLGDSQPTDGGQVSMPEGQDDDTLRP
jgi:hypothetical protein